jgi:hypothetical protein
MSAMFPRGKTPATGGRNERRNEGLNLFGRPRDQTISDRKIRSPRSNEETTMLRKTVLAIAAAATIAAVAAPSAVFAKGGHGHHHHHKDFGISIGVPYGYGYGYSPYYVDEGPDCYFKKVKVWSHKWDKWIWKTKKICY